MERGSRGPAGGQPPPLAPGGRGRSYAPSAAGGPRPETASPPPDVKAPIARLPSLKRPAGSAADHVTAPPGPARTPQFPAPAAARPSAVVAAPAGPAGNAAPSRRGCAPAPAGPRSPAIAGWPTRPTGLDAGAARSSAGRQPR